MSDASGTEVDIPARAPRAARSRKSGGAASYQQAIAALGKLPAVEDLQNAKKLKDKDKKYIDILVGANQGGGEGGGQNDYVSALFGESYDRRLLKLAGIS
jgi:hypothetical protein